MILATSMVCELYSLPAGAADGRWALTVLSAGGVVQLAPAGALRSAGPTFVIVAARALFDTGGTGMPDGLVVGSPRRGHPSVRRAMLAHLRFSLALRRRRISPMLRPLLDLHLLHPK